MSKKKSLLIVLIILLCTLVAVSGTYLYTTKIAGAVRQNSIKKMNVSIKKGAAESSALVKGSVNRARREIRKKKAIEAGEYEDIDIKRNTEAAKWESDIAKIEGRYGADLPQGCVIFYGSSSIRKWKTLEEDMSELDVLNHGFGGSMTGDCLYYADRMIVPFEPKAIVYYAGTNDIGKGRDVETTYQNTIDFFKYIRFELPETRIYYIEQTNQPDRDSKWYLMQELDARVKEYVEGDDLITYIETADALHNEDGSIRYELFLEDGLHFNSTGYEVWTTLIQPVLYKDLTAPAKKAKT